MTKKELIQKADLESKAIYSVIESDIKKEIQNTIITAPQNAIDPIQGLKGLSTNGFYMIFNDIANVNSNCTCSFVYGGKTYYCVYRGHSVNIKDRIDGHLFYDNKKTGVFMRVEINGNRYHINILNKKLFGNPALNYKKTSFNNTNWRVLKISLNGSKQFLREMFEKAFDETYQKPPYSDK